MNLTEARPIMATAIELLRPYCQTIEVAGSIRRGKPEVKDGELVCRSNGSLADFKRHLWRMVTKGLFSWSRYVDKNGHASYRQGEKYYGLDFRGLRLEVFMADEQNWGYIYWLRTGPGEANQFVMQHLLRAKCPYRAHNGYWWTLDNHQIALPSEADLFSLLGLPVLAPNERSVERYQALFTGPNHRWGTPQAVIAPTTVQPTLF